jgi:integrase
MRTCHKQEGQNRSFNQARSAVQSYLRSTLGRQNPIYIAVSNIEPLDGTPKRQGNPLSVPVALTIKDKMKEPMASMFWSLCLTGMGWHEYVGAWEIEGETVRIHGTKRKGRDRIIPKLGELVVPSVPDKVFRRSLRSASKRQVQPYDCRRTFARWLNEAEVFDVHQSCYMGHGAKSITALYKTPRIVSEILEQDRVKVTAYLKQESRKKVNSKADEFFGPSQVSCTP